MASVLTALPTATEPQVTDDCEQEQVYWSRLSLGVLLVMLVVTVVLVSLWWTYRLKWESLFGEPLWSSADADHAAVRIPLIMHHIHWDDSQAPATLETRVLQQIRDLHTSELGWSHRKWNRSDLVKLAEAQFTGVRLTKTTAPLMVLAAYGGVYMTPDFWCLKPLNGMLGCLQCVLVAAPGSQRHPSSKPVDASFDIAGGFIAATPGHPFIQQCLTRCSDDPASLQSALRFVLADDHYYLRQHARLALRVYHPSYMYPDQPVQWSSLEPHSAQFISKTLVAQYPNAYAIGTK